MKKIISFLFMVILFLCPIIADAAYREYNEEYVEGDVLIVMEAPKASDYKIMGVFNENLYSWALSNQTEGFARSRGLEARNTYPEIARFSGKNIIKLRSEHKSTAQLMRELSSDPNVESVQPNYIRRANLIPNDPYYPDNAIWINFWGQVGMVFINMPQVWNYFRGSSNIAVAVIDTGIDYNHPDLNANMAKDSFGNYGRRFYNMGTVSSNAMDIHNHGTHVAGIIGAVGNNGIGVTGVNWNVKMLNVNVFTENAIAPGIHGAYDEDIIYGINYVVSEKNKGLNIRVANMSLGGLSAPQQNNTPLGNAVKLLSDQGIICVMAAGNDSTNLNTSMQKHYPSCFRFDNTIAVGNISHYNGFRDISSNFGDNWVDIGAPGALILSTIRSNDLSNTFSFVGLRGYDYMTGTSMSAPHVAGVAALLCAAYSNETASQIKERILNGASKNYMSGNPGCWAHGTLDAWAAYYNQFEPPIIITSYVEGHHWCQIDTQIAYGSIPMTWTILNGNLPDNLELRSDGFLTGTTGACTEYITLEVTNAYGSDINTIEINVMFKK